VKRNPEGNRLLGELAKQRLGMSLFRALQGAAILFLRPDFAELIDGGELTFDEIQALMIQSNGKATAKGFASS